MKIIKKLILTSFFAISLSGCNKKNDFSSVANQETKTESVQNEKEIVTIIPSNPYTEIPKKIDLDFTKMNYNMASSIMFEMLVEPEKYIEKTVKIEGQFETSVYEGNRYFSVVNWDLTGCCPSGLNFIPPDSMEYPVDFPESSSLITVKGIMKEAFNGEDNQLYFFATNFE